jgi:hypothetical protein
MPTAGIIIKRVLYIYITVLVEGMHYPTFDKERSCGYHHQEEKEEPVIAIYPVRQRLEHKIAAIKILTRCHKYLVQCHIYDSCVSTVDFKAPIFGTTLFIAMLLNP